MTLPTLKTLRNKADRLLTPYIKRKYPDCLFCGKPTQVAHHHLKKEKCGVLRYEESNLIPLCIKCHFTLHKHETYWASKIVEIKGLAWFKKLDTMKNKNVKYNRNYYEEAIKKYQIH